MILLIILLGSALSDDWNYTESGTDWTDICATGQAQSPIEIDPSITERVDRRSDDLITLEFTLEEVTVEGEFEPAAYKIKGDLGNMTATRGSDNTFYGGVISNIHFHSPSENVINGVQSWFSLRAAAGGNAWIQSPPAAPIRHIHPGRSGSR